MAEQILIFDIDGTLASVSGRRQQILEAAGMKFREGFSPACQVSCLREIPPPVLDKFMDPKLLIEEDPLPNVQMFLRRDTRPRYFLTSRWERLRSITTMWLERVGWEKATGFMRSDNDTDMPAVRVKCEHLINRFSDYDDQVLVVDDDPKMVLAAKTLGFNAIMADKFFSITG